MSRRHETYRTTKLIATARIDRDDTDTNITTEILTGIEMTMIEIAEIIDFAPTDAKNDGISETTQMMIMAMGCWQALELPPLLQVLLLKVYGGIVTKIIAKWTIHN